MREETSITKLLEHASWVRALATRLARGDEDDAVQELWLSALRSPPEAERDPRPWLARVLGNAARKRFRDDQTRLRNEVAAGAVAEASFAESPEALVGHAQAHRLVVEALLELEEPFRKTLLLRFFEGLTSEELSARLGVHAGTVRWRLKEGLDRLRTRLDARHGGDRRQWLLAIAPLVVPSASPWLSAGATLIAKSARLGFVGGLGLVVSLLLGGALWSTPDVLLGAADAGVTPSVARDSPARTGVAAEAPFRGWPPLAATGSPSRVFPVPAVPVVPRGTEPARDAMGRSTQTLGATPARARFSLDGQGIARALQSANPELLECVESWHQFTPMVDGTFVISLTIDTDDGEEGHVSRVSQVVPDGGASLGPTALEGCLLASIAALRFDPPLDGPVFVTFPFSFRFDRK